MNQTDTDTDGNVRGDVHFIACTEARCAACERRTRLVALAAPAGHERMEAEENPFAAGPTNVWQMTQLPAFLFYLTYLPASLRERLQAAAPRYRFAADASTGETYWANHCAYCGEAFDDVALFCEPGGAFMPMSPEEAAAISLTRVAERFTAAAAGYSGEPELFDFMPQN